MTIYNNDGKTFLDYPMLSVATIRDSIARYCWSKDLRGINGNIDIGDFLTAIFVSKDIYSFSDSYVSSMFDSIESLLVLPEVIRTNVFPRTMFRPKGVTFPLVVSPSPFWLMSPVLLSFFYLMLRISTHKTYPVPSMDAAVYFDVKQHSKSMPYGERCNFENLAKSIKGGNFEKMLNKDLKCMHRDDFEDYKFDNPQRTFWNYSEEKEKMNVAM